MASKAKKSVADPRRARLDELRAQQKASERKRTMLIVGIAAVVGLLIIGLAAFPLYQQWQEGNRPVADFGVSAAAANCGEVIDDPATGANDHVGPGTATPDVTTIEYATAPPSSGQHFGVSSGFARNFYTRDDTPPVENLVHNLEHGATIVWYDDAVSDEEVDELEGLANRITADAPKFIVAAWSSERGDFPEGSIAMSHWSDAPEGSAEGTPGTGHRQYCEQVSGEAINEFVVEFPYTDSPEPNAG